MRKMGRIKVEKTVWYLSCRGKGCKNKTVYHGERLPSMIGDGWYLKDTELCQKCNIKRITRELEDLKNKKIKDINGKIIKKGNVVIIHGGFPTIYKKIPVYKKVKEQEIIGEIGIVIDKYPRTDSIRIEMNLIDGRSFYPNIKGENLEIIAGRLGGKRCK